MTDLADLLARVEGARGPDRELDALIWLACGLDPVCGSPMSGETRAGRFKFRPGQPLSLLVAKYPKFIDLAAVACQPAHVTTSLDAAVALAERVLPGFDADINIRRSDDEDMAAYLWPSGTYIGGYGGHGKTPALALLAAMLRALSSTFVGRGITGEGETSED